jgi:CHAT domain-containing protein
MVLTIEEIERQRLQAQAIGYTGDLETALDLFNKLEQRAKQINEPAAVGLVWRGRANVYQRHGFSEQCLAATDRAVAAFNSIDDAYGVAVSQIIAVAALGNLDRHTDMFALADQIRPILRQNPKLHAILENNLGNKCGEAWLHEDALLAYKEARRLFLDQAEYLRAARIIHNMGLMALQKDDFEQAQRYFEQAEIEFAATPDPPSAVKLQLNIQELQLRRGDLERALQTNHRARKLLSETPTQVDYALVHIAESRIRRALNEHGQAVVLLHKAIAQLGQMNHTGELAVSLLELAHVLIDNPSHDNLLKALDAQTQAGEILAPLDTPLLSALVDLEQGEVLHHLGRDTDAVIHAERARITFGRFGLTLRLGQAVALAADCTQHLYPMQAQSDYRTALDLVSDSVPLIAVRCWRGLGRLAATERDFVSAESHYTTALDLLDTMRRGLSAHHHQAGFLDDKQQIGEELLAALHAQDNSTERLLGWIERFKARALADLLSGVPGVPTDAAIDATLRELLAERDAVARAYDLRRTSQLIGSSDSLTAARQRSIAISNHDARLQAELADLRRQMENLDARIDNYNNIAYAWHSGRDKISVSVHDMLDENSLFVSYYVAGGHLHAITATNKLGSLATKPLNVSLATIRKAWQQSRRRVIRPKSRPADVQQRLGQLYNWLLAPLHNEIGDHKRLIIVPHSSLFHVPFAGLFDRSAGQYVIERWSIQIVPSATIWQHCRQLPTGTQQPLLLGYPGKPEQADYLPNVGIEIDTLATLLPEADTLKDDQATQSALLEQMPQRSFVHLAGHIFYDSADSLASGMPLADGRWLRASDLYLRFGQLGGATVVLSGCESARVQSLGGDVLGLTSAFLYAGASGLVAGLWKVDDAATAQLMTAFYAALLDGKDSAEALRQAQRTLLNSDSFSQPYYWAAFTLNGDARKL